MKSFFITGTGTGIGKTHFTGQLAKLAVSKNLRTAVMKPVQTGITKIEEGDIGTVARMAPGVLPLPSELACPYLLKMECSPHLAAEAEGVEIKFDRIGKAVERVKREFSPDLLLFEGAGGVCVPLSQKYMAVELMAQLGVPALVVALAGLGSINHTLLSIKELRANGVEVAGVAINFMPAKPGPIELDNLKMIRKLSGVEILAVTREGASDFKTCEGLEKLLAENA